MEDASSIIYLKELLKDHCDPKFISVATENIPFFKLVDDDPQFASIAKVLFHQEQFSSWLHTHFEPQDEKEFYTKFNSENFRLYYQEYSDKLDQKVEDSTVEAIRKRIVFGQLKPVTKFEYDIDLVASFIQLSKLLDKAVLNQSDNNYKNQFLLSMRSPVEFAAKEFQLSAEDFIGPNYPIIVDQNTPGYEFHLARTLMSFDINKVNAVLDYQFAIWEKPNFFPSLVEHQVYNYIKNNSPFDNSSRLEKIMNWVEKIRIFKRIVPQGESSTKETASTKLGTETSTPKMHFWPGSIEKLNMLHDLLVERNLIEPHTDIVALFSGNGYTSNNKVIWAGKKPI